MCHLRIQVVESGWVTNINVLVVGVVEQARLGVVAEDAVALMYELVAVGLRLAQCTLNEGGLSQLLF